MTSETLGTVGAVGLLLQALVLGLSDAIPGTSPASGDGPFR